MPGPITSPPQLPPPYAPPVPKAPPAAPTPPVPVPVPTNPAPPEPGDPGAITAREIVNAATNSSASLREIADIKSAVDAMKGAQLASINYQDPSAPAGDPAKSGSAIASTSGLVTPGAIFDSRSDALAIAVQGAHDLRGSINAQGASAPVGPGHLIAQFGSRYALLQASLAEAAAEPHPLTAEFVAPGAATPATGATDEFQSWTPHPAASFTAIDPRIVAVVDGLSNIVPQVVPAPAPAPNPAPAPAPTPTPKPNPAPAPAAPSPLERVEAVARDTIRR